MMMASRVTIVDANRTNIVHYTCQYVIKGYSNLYTHYSIVLVEALKDFCNLPN